MFMQTQPKLVINEIYNMDCIEGMQQMNENSVDLIITSPPYNLDINYGNYDDNKSITEYYKWCSEWIAECYKVLKPGGRFCLQVGPHQSNINEPTSFVLTEISRKEG